MPMLLTRSALSKKPRYESAVVYTHTFIWWCQLFYGLAVHDCCYDICTVASSLSQNRNFWCFSRDPNGSWTFHVNCFSHILWRALCWCRINHKQRRVCWNTRKYNKVFGKKNITTQRIWFAWFDHSAWIRLNQNWQNVNEEFSLLSLLKGCIPCLWHWTIFF